MPKVSRKKSKVEESNGHISGPNLIKRIEQDIKAIGVVGEVENAVTAYVTYSSRKLKESRGLTIRGKSGAGKDLVVQAIHALSSVGDEPLVTLNCNNVSVNLLESELFGHERGAFTDAKEQKKGLLEVADGGTLFLDEIGLMPLELQSKLLKVFETQQFRRVGGTDTFEVAVRFLAATNEDLEKAMGEGRFREDLYYRLNVVPIHLSPLRELDGDVQMISDRSNRDSSLKPRIFSVS